MISDYLKKMNAIQSKENKSEEVEMAPDVTGSKVSN